MITTILFLWIGKALEAGAWYYILLAIGIVFQVRNMHRDGIRGEYKKWKMSEWIREIF